MADGGAFEELEEEEVWAVMTVDDVNKERSPKARRAKEPPPSPAPPRRRQPFSAPRAIHTSTTPHADDHVVSSGKAFVRQSAPVNIPDWSKIYGGRNKGGGYNIINVGDGDHGDREKASTSGTAAPADEGDDDEDEGGDGMLPPHEWIARKLARSQISSFSVCEGAGRTLKGRDLSRVRNAVLTRTGFLE